MAHEAGISLVTVKRLEATAGRFQGKAETLWKIQQALENAGVVFQPGDEKIGPGVRLAKASAE